MAEVSQLEQWILELINRVRLDPLSAIPITLSSLNQGLPAGTISEAPKYALSMSDFLLLSSDFHNNWIRETGIFDTEGHEGSTPGERMAYAGFGGGAEFNWAETIHWLDYPPGTVIDESSLPQTYLLTRFLNDPAIRQIVLSDAYTEIGISAGAGFIAGTSERAGVTVQDFASSPDIYITGGIYQNADFLNFFTAQAPTGIAGIDVTTSSAATESNTAGGYRIRVTDAQVRLTIGGATVDVTMPGGNVKLDLIGTNHLRSSHSISVVSGATQAELIGAGEESLTALDTAGAIHLFGNRVANHLVGNNSANLLDGRQGADLMEGAGGDDEYRVDTLADRAIEQLDNGFDTVVLDGIYNYALAAGSSIELLRLQSDINYGVAVVLTGNELSQEIRGHSGLDRLDGGGGGDTLIGGWGDDIYTIRSAADVIVEQANQGNDHVRAYVSYMLNPGAAVDSMETAEAAATTAIDLTGNEFGQFITGNAGRNVLRGGGGEDRLVGGLGKDTLYGGSGNDQFHFLRPADSAIGDQRDTIADWAAGDIIYLGFDGNLSQQFDQQLQFIGLGTADRIVGQGQVKYYNYGGNTYLVGNIDADNQADFQIEILGTHAISKSQLWGTVKPAVNGTTGSDVLTGFAGDDLLFGNLGRDLLRGGTGADTFIYQTLADSQVGDQRDVIADWAPGDLIDLKVIDAHVSNYGDQDFLFVNDNTVGRNVEQGTLRTYQFGGNTYVIGNTTADNEADFQIEIVGLHTLSYSDFIGVTNVSVIEGSSSDDVLRGTSLADRIAGNMGRDVLYGGAGADTFAYRYDWDSQAGAQRDTIADWEARDMIDLSAFDAIITTIGQDTFIFDGLGTPDRLIAQQHLKYYHYAGNTYVVAGTNTTGQANFQIELTGNHILTSANFIGLGRTPVQGTNAGETVNGTSGNDAIRGGLGTDLLYGRGGSDHFIFASAAESVLGFERDVIMDWSADDKLDLRGMDAYSSNEGIQAYTFVGLGSADRNVGQGAVKYYQYGDNTYVVGNATPDGTADFQIEIRGLHTLSAADFIL